MSEVEEVNKEQMNNEQLEEKFILRRECVLKEESVTRMGVAMETVKEDIVEIKESLASIATWMEGHNKTHDKAPGGWKKAQTFAVIASVVVASLSLLASTTVGIITVVVILGKP